MIFMVGLVFLNNIPCQFPLRLSIIINYHIGTAVLVLWLLVILLHPCMYSTNCFAVVKGVACASNVAVIDLRKGQLGASRTGGMLVYFE